MKKRLKVLIACEFSGVVRRAFRALGHDAVSCDLLEAEDGSPHHIQGDVLDIIDNGWWDLMIAHPPCTRLTVAGARWFKGREKEQDEALEFVSRLMSCKIPRIALENPIGVISSRIRKPDQIVQPWMFGHMELKATCLWLKNLPALKPTDVLDPPRRKNFRNPDDYDVEYRKWARCHQEPPGPDRWKNRSRTFKGIAAAMAKQWGCVTL